MANFYLDTQLTLQSNSKRPTLLNGHRERDPFYVEGHKHECERLDRWGLHTVTRYDDPNIGIETVSGL